MNLNLTNQENIEKQISPKLLQMKTELDKRKGVWVKLNTVSKKKWILSGKDPIMNIAWSIYKYLRNNFFDEETDEYL